MPALMMNNVTVNILLHQWSPKFSCLCPPLPRRRGQSRDMSPGGRGQGKGAEAGAAAAGGNGTEDGSKSGDRSRSCGQAMFGGQDWGQGWSRPTGRAGLGGIPSPPSIEGGPGPTVPPPKSSSVPLQGT